MLLPPLFERDLAVLVEERKRLSFARAEIDDIARGLNASPAFADNIERLDYAIAEIAAEIRRRAN